LFSSNSYTSFSLGLTCNLCNEQSSKRRKTAAAVRLDLLAIRCLTVLTPLEVFSLQIQEKPLRTRHLCRMSSVLRTRYRLLFPDYEWAVGKGKRGITSLDEQNASRQSSDFTDTRIIPGRGQAVEQKGVQHTSVVSRFGIWCNLQATKRRSLGSQRSDFGRCQKTHATTGTHDGIDARANIKDGTRCAGVVPRAFSVTP
jgi:hypothetical protein